MRAANIQRLITFGTVLDYMPHTAVIQEHERLEVFGRFVPDQAGHLAALGEEYSVDNLGILCKVLEYDGAPELLSMWLCILQARLGTHRAWDPWDPACWLFLPFRMQLPLSKPHAYGSSRLCPWTCQLWWLGRRS